MRDLLVTGLDRLELDANDALCDALLSYAELLQKWNKTYNLTSIKDPFEILNRHILDSLSVSSFIEGQHCLDIGTGAGLPGLILALVQPERNWVLLDSNQKKLRFLRHVKADLDINNVEIVHSRIEQYQPKREFNTLICRAFAPLPRILELADHLITDTNYLLAMKGKQIDVETAQISDARFDIEMKEVPFFDNDNVARLVKINRIGTHI